MVTKAPSARPPSRRLAPSLAVPLVLAGSLLLAGCGGSDAPTTSGTSSAGASPAAPPGAVEQLLDAQQLTVLDQPIAYPKKKPAQVSSSIVTLEPGQETGWHKQKVPTYEYVLEGTLTVEYDAGVTKDFPAGTALMEAVGVFSNGTNKGDAAVRVLTVQMGAEGVKSTVPRTP
jgi:quercetin dioxygenase-like cupin family protein